MAGALAHHITPDLADFVRSVFWLRDPSELDGLLRSAGFHDVTVQTTTKTLRLPSPAEFLWQYIHATPMAVLVADADDGRRDKLGPRWERSCFGRRGSRKSSP